jgi:hypothetical protein
LLVHVFDSQVGSIDCLKGLNVFGFVLFELGFVLFRQFFSFVSVLLFLISRELLPLNSEFFGDFSDGSRDRGFFFVRIEKKSSEWSCGFCWNKESVFEDCPVLDSLRDTENDSVE